MKHCILIITEMNIKNTVSQNLNHIKIYIKQNSFEGTRWTPFPSKTARLNENSI